MLVILRTLPRDTRRYSIWAYLGTLPDGLRQSITNVQPLIIKSRLFITTVQKSGLAQLQLTHNNSHLTPTMSYDRGKV